jgi:hypothetical protein
MAANTMSHRAKFSDNSVPATVYLLETPNPPILFVVSPEPAATSQSRHYHGPRYLLYSEQAATAAAVLRWPRLLQGRRGLGILPLPIGSCEEGLSTTPSVDHDRLITVIANFQGILGVTCDAMFSCVFCIAPHRG